MIILEELIEIGIERNAENRRIFDKSIAAPEKSTRKKEEKEEL